MSKSDPIDPAVPAGSEDPKLGDDRIRELAAAVAEILGVDHYIGTNGGAGTGYNEDAAGEHAKVTIRNGSAPTAAAGKGFLYVVSGELYYKDPSGNVIQLTSGGILNSLNLTGNQTAAGNKTFSGVVVLGNTSALASSAAPTADAQIANKKYVDDRNNIVQVVNTQTGAVATGTTVMPDDDTIPQLSEGVQFMSLSVTPTSATNKLKIDVVLFLSHSSTGGEATLTAALFQDSSADALAAMQHTDPYNRARPISFTHYMTAGTTIATTFKVRAGCDVAGTSTFNGMSGGRRMGGIMASSITITEIRV